MSLEKSAFSAAFRDAVGIPQPKWIEWIHVSMGKTHCPTCLRLDKCWFADSKKPPLPQHPFLSLQSRSDSFCAGANGSIGIKCV